MKNGLINKIICAVVLIALLGATIFGAVAGITGINTQMVTIDQADGTTKQEALKRIVSFIPNTINKNWKEAIQLDTALGGGYSYTLTADKGTMSDADYKSALNKAAAVLTKRAEMVSASASAKVTENGIVVTVPESDYNSSLYYVLTPAGKVTFALYNSETSTFNDALCDSSIVDTAYYSVSDSTYTIQLKLNAKGEKQLQDIISANSYQYLYMLLDGQAIAYVYMYNGIISSNMVSFTASDGNNAFIGTIVLRGGEMPFDMTLDTYTAAAATAGSLTDVAIIVVAAALLLVCVFMIVRNVKAGLLGTWTVVAGTVAFFLCTALLVVTSAWRLGVFGLIVFALCLASLAFGVMTVIGKAAASVKKGRDLTASVNAGVTSNAKLLGIVYGAMLAVALLLMFIFQSASLGITGRIIGAMALIDLIMVFIFLPVVSACIKGLRK